MNIGSKIRINFHEILIIIFSTILFYSLATNYCRAYNKMYLWKESIPYIKAHDAFYPHPHLKDLKLAAKKGKILVVTLVVSAGLMVLISTAVIRSGKDKDKDDMVESISPADLRSRVISSAAAGKQFLGEGPDSAVRAALKTYATSRGVEWKEGTISYSPDVIYNVGKDQVIVYIKRDSKDLEVKVLCGKIGASAIACDDGSIRSMIFTADAYSSEEPI